MKKILTLLMTLIGIFSNLFTPTAQAAERPEKLNVAIVQLVSHPSLDQIAGGIYEELETQGYKEGDNLTVDFQNAEGDLNLLTNIADQVIGNNPDLIFAITTPVAQAFQNATSDLPILFCGVTDPVASNIVTNPDQPEANITGTTDVVPLEDHFQLMLDIDPSIETVGMIYATNEDSALAEIEDAQEVLKEKFGKESVVEGIADALDMQMVAENLASKVDAIYIPSDNTIAASFATLADATDQAGIPIFPSVDSMVHEGGVAAIALDQADLGRQAVRMGLKHLEGTPISEIPVESVENLKKMVNTDAADKLGIEIPEEILKEAYNVSEE